MSEEKGVIRLDAIYDSFPDKPEVFRLVKLLDDLSVACNGETIYAAAAIAICSGRNATTDGTRVPEEEMKRLLEWIKDTGFQACLIGLLLRGIVSAYHKDGEERSFALSDMGRKAAPLMLERAGMLEPGK